MMTGNGLATTACYDLMFPRDVKRLLMSLINAAKRDIENGTAYA
jgi:hypothetical protein